MNIKGIRKGMRELKEVKFPYRHEYHYGFHDAIERCNKLIEQQIRIYNKAKREFLFMAFIKKGKDNNG